MTILGSLLNSSDEAIGLVTRISLRTENHILSCLKEPTAGHHCITWLGCEVTSESSLPSAWLAQSLSQFRQWHRPYLHPVSWPLLSRLQARPTGGNWMARTIRKYTQSQEVLTSMGQHCTCSAKSGARTIPTSTSLSSHSAPALLTSKGQERHKEIPNSVVLGPCTHLKTNTNHRADSCSCQSKELPLKWWQRGAVQKIRGLGVEPEAVCPCLVGTRVGPSCCMTTPQSYSLHSFEKHSFLVAREGFKNSRIWSYSVKLLQVRGGRWKYR